MNKQKRQMSFLIGILLLVFMLFVVVVIAAVAFMFTDRLPAVGRPTVALAKITGIISESEPHTQLLRKYAQNPVVKAIVVRIDSPGGAVGASQELHHEILKTRKKGKKPIVVSMGNMGASGGIYVASAADEIYANPGTVTGSIGVVFRTYDLQGISEKVGVGTNTVKSGKFKDIGSSFREMTPEEREIIQSAIDDTYNQFLDALIEGRRTKLAEAYLRRNARETTPALTAGDDSTTQTETDAETIAPDDVPLETVRKYLQSISDGRIFTGRQAMELGLIDHLGDLQDAIERAGRLAGATGRPHVIQEKRRPPSIFGFMEGRSNVLSQLGLPNGVSLEYRLCFD